MRNRQSRATDGPFGDKPVRCVCCGKDFRGWSASDRGGYYLCLCGAKSYEGHDVLGWPDEIPKGFLAVGLGEPL